MPVIDVSFLCFDKVLSCDLWLKRIGIFLKGALNCCLSLLLKNGNFASTVRIREATSKFALFQQSTQLQVPVQYTPLAKHSQYSLTHRDCLQLQHRF